jgi:hypothetical protein
MVDGVNVRPRQRPTDATTDRDRIAKVLTILHGAKSKSNLVMEIEQALVP